MADIIKIKRGVDIKLVGEADKEYAQDFPLETVAIKPPDFHGVRMKLLLKEGDEVKAGTPVLFNRDDEPVKFCSPVSGEIAQVVRGAKRRILEIRILADKNIDYLDFEARDPKKLNREQVIDKLTVSGCWPFIKERPFNVIASTTKIPKAIFISGFDSAPLAPDMDILLGDQKQEFQAGIDALSHLTGGAIHLGLRHGDKIPAAFEGISGVETHYFSGPHPAGLAGVQIHRISPINKGETVWTLSPEHVIIIGRLFLTGKFDARVNIALTGSEVKNRKYHRTMYGASVKHFVENNLSEQKNRIISGNVLTGTRITDEGYLGAFDRQVTVIPEGDEPELFGWILPKTDRFSISRTLPAWLMPKKKYVLNANLHGEERAFVVTGQYERVFPFDIYPLQLMKSILIEDIEQMENLGLYEVVEEDFALCEFVCTSKMPIQQIVRNGLNLMKKELG